jgi:hypothetical protein
MASETIYYTTSTLFVKATWRNGSAFGFDRLTVPKGCRFESCGGHFFFSLAIIQSFENFLFTYNAIVLFFLVRAIKL